MVLKTLYQAISGPIQRCHCTVVRNAPGLLRKKDNQEKLIFTYGVATRDLYCQLRHRRKTVNNEENVIFPLA
jgi:hypothetical protein